MSSDEIAVELRSVIKQFPNPGGGMVNAVDDVSILIKSGEFFSLLGPSGCGKTTSLRMIAGFEWPTEGEVFIMGQPMGHKPPYLRQVNTVFQSYALFQHMTIAQNVAFGLEMDRLPKAEINRRVGQALEMVKLGGMEARRPRQLSGGQQQRVALARALVKRPQVLLLDEPLGALDLKLRKEMQLELKVLQSQVGITFIYVTHDQEEALTMSDRIAVMSGGKVLQIGPAVEIYERPKCRFVADFIGETNLFSGSLLSLEPGRATIHIPELKCDLVGLPQPGLVVGQAVAVSIRPEKIRLAAAPTSYPGNDQYSNSRPNPNNLTARVEEVVYIGSDTRIILNTNGRRISVWEQNRLSTLDANAHYQRGQDLWLVVFAENILVMPED